MNRFLSKFIWISFLLFSKAVSGQTCEWIEVQASLSLGLYPEEVSWSIVDLDSNVVAGPFSNFQAGSIYTWTLCLEPGCYLAHTMDSYGDGWQGALLSLSVVGEETWNIQMEGAQFESYTPISFGAICGCTDENAVNYDPAATANNGTCYVCEEQPVFISMVTGLWASELSWALMDTVNNVVLEGSDLWGPDPWADFTAYESYACISEGCYSIALMDSYGDGWQGGEISLSIPTDSGMTTLASGTVPPNAYDNMLPVPLDPDCPVWGCTFPSAWNYNPSANEDDGSCIRQADNVSLFGHWTDESLPVNGLNGRFSDVEGLKVNGREFAILGSTMGTHILDVSSPGTPDEVTFLAGAYGGSVTHRDYHIDGNILYAVCDQGSSTLQCFDLSALPDTVITLYDSDELVRTAHNVFVDNSTDRLYACSMSRTGFSSPVLILDVSDPSDPIEIGNLAPLVSGCHDIYVENDTAWVNGGGAVSVIQIGAEPSLIGLLDEYPFQGGNHSGWWVSEDDVYVFADETHGSPLKVVDTSDMDDLQVLSLLSSGTAPDAIPHNLMIRDQLVFVSYYHDGLQVFDISHPDEPQLVAYYDTYAPDSHSGFAGAWGVHAALPSGLILISDVQSGLFVLELDPEVLQLCPSQPLNWNGLEILDEGYWSTVIEDPTWGTDIAWATVQFNEDVCITCMGDFDQDCNRTAIDLLFMLSEWGCAAGCTSDINENGVVDIADILLFLSLFAIPCC